MRAGLGIGQRVMMIGKVKAAGRRHSLQLVVRQRQAKVPARCRQRIIKLIIRIIHLIYAVRRLQAPLVKVGIVRHQRQPLD